MSIIQINLLKKFGLSDDEINLYGTDFLLQYLKYHHKTDKTDKSSILFLGFKGEELDLLIQNALDNDLEVKQRIGNLTFVCVSENFSDTKRISKAKEWCIYFLSKNEFLEIFKKGEYLINENENIYIKSGREEFRITKPLSNFDYIIKVGSFSYNDDFEFDVNLYKGTCNCPDFIASKRLYYPQGDLRRYCKHMLNGYSCFFKPRNFFDVKQFLIENSRALKSNFKMIILPKLEKPVYLNYNLNGEDCDIYFPNKKNEYERYSYDYETGYFAYNDKPNGYLKDLRIELRKVFNPQKEFHKKRKIREHTKEIDANVNGCLYFFVFVVFILCLIFS